MKQYQRKTTPNVQVWFWLGGKFPPKVPTWIRKFCRVNDLGHSRFTIVADTKTGIAKSFGSCWVVKEHDGGGVYLVDSITFNNDYRKVVI